MNKEKFLSTLKSMSGNDNHMHIIISMIEKFLDSNVCIPKGENRHPYADVFHEWAEDTTKQVQYYDCIWLNSNYLETSFTLRIKPSEPVYEWQYKYQKIISGLWEYTKPMTDDEFNEYEYPVGFEPIKDENTKRVRQ